MLDEVEGTLGVMPKQASPTPDAATRRSWPGLRSAASTPAWRRPASRARGARARRTPEPGPPARASHQIKEQAGRTRSGLAARRPEAVRAAAGPVPGRRPGRARPGAAPAPGGGGCLTMSCSRMGKPHTAIGDAPFHFRVRDGFGWVRRSMVVRRIPRPPRASAPGGRQQAVANPAAPRRRRHA